MSLTENMKHSLDFKVMDSENQILTGQTSNHFGTLSLLTTLEDSTKQLKQVLK
jgi:hypothetical protein